jgi:hypothetical protein
LTLPSDSPIVSATTAVHSVTTGAQFIVIELGFSPFSITDLLNHTKTLFSFLSIWHSTNPCLPAGILECKKLLREESGDE